MRKKSGKRVRRWRAIDSIDNAELLAVNGGVGRLFTSFAGA
jgi:hypothetical protein